MRIISSLTILGALVALAPAASLAGGWSDGRTGPVEITGHAIDDAMTALNDFIQAKNAQANMMASLDVVPGPDFETVASAVSAAPFDRAAPNASEFGWTINGGSALDVHLAAFNDDLKTRGQDLFIRIATAETAKGMDFASVASDVYSGFDGGGRVRDDVTLNAEMQDLLEGMRQFDDRAARVSQAVPQVSGTSFDRYIEALQLF